MNFAIIAAGEGSRLAQEGVALPKPLVKLCGEAMIDRLVRIFRENGAERICIIVNRLHPQTEAHVRELMAKPATCGRIELVVETTPSSMHSFAALAPLLEGEPFCLTTVDTIFREDEFAQYVKAFRDAPELDGLMAVTDFIDDEKPLYVATAGADASLRGAAPSDTSATAADALRITGFLDANAEGRARYISGGIYALRPAALATLRRCMAEGQSRMRNFQRGLVADGLRLRAFPMTKVLDVDHADDIRKAEAFLAAR